MTKIDTEYFKNKLLEEKTKLISELKTVARINPDNPNDWEPLPGEKNEDTADANDFAGSIENYEENTALVKELETQLKEVDSALGKIESGKYGFCEISGEEIENDRLEANPAARTCKAHINE
jgi:RNA polymerase-binding transcription factor DksA